jgi:molybdopterin molybdotransferase
MISIEQALNTVQEKLAGAEISPGTEGVPLAAAAGRVLAEDIAADRDYPPFHRAIRDGFAVRAADVSVPPALLRLCGEVRAGEHFPGVLAAGDCVAIMTGAPLPAGADAVVMVEHTEIRGDRVEIQSAVHPAENVVHRASEAPSGVRVLARGKRLGAGEVALLASVGKSRVSVFAQPRVAILATGDEVVPVEQRPEWFQIRNSNALMLSAQVAAAGGIPQPLGIAPDRLGSVRAMIEEGLRADLLLLSGGVSVGKYDFVGQALAGLDAEFYIQGVALRPGKPLVFGRAAGTFFFGLPGNPVSTYITFELFARPAIAALGGATHEAVVFLRARLAQPLEVKAGLTTFLPARLACPSGDPVVSPVGWQGSGDLVGVAAANCFLVVHPDQTNLAAGDWVDVTPRVQ